MEKQSEHRHNLADTIRLLSRVADNDTSGVNGIIGDALYWLKELKRKLDSIELIEYETAICPSSGAPPLSIKSKKYLCYNTAVVSEAEAMAILAKGEQDSDPRVVDLWPKQAVSLFPDLLRQNVPPAEQSSETTTKPPRHQKTCPSCGAAIQDSACPGPYEGDRDGYGWIVSQFDCPRCGDHLGAYYDEDNGDCFDHIQAI